MLEIIILKPQFGEAKNIVIQNCSSLTIEWDFVIAKKDITSIELEYITDMGNITIARKSTGFEYTLVSKDFGKYIGDFENDKILLVNVDFKFHQKSLKLKIVYCNQIDCHNEVNKDLGTILITGF